jgi:uncharacterized membrane protein
MTDPINLLIGTLWGGATVWAWSVVLWRSYRSWIVRHDPRSRRELRFMGILWLCALSFSLALMIVVVTPDQETGRKALFGLFCGMFTVAGATLALSEGET